MADVVAAGVKAMRAVQLGALQQVHTEFAQVADAAHARSAAAAGGDEAHHDVVALRDIGDPLTDFHDDARAFMAADHRHGHLQVAGDQVLVGVTHAARGHLDHHLAVPWAVEVEFLDLPFLMKSPQHGGFRLHRRLLLEVWWSKPIIASLADFRL